MFMKHNYGFTVIVNDKIEVNHILYKKEISITF